MFQYQYLINVKCNYVVRENYFGLDSFHHICIYK